MIRKTSNKLICAICSKPATNREEGLPVCNHCKGRISKIVNANASDKETNKELN